MKNHKCKKIDYCICSVLALEPDENCPVHGYPWPPRCVECGRFMKWDNTNQDFYAIAKYELACFENENSFLIRFGQGNCWQLVEVFFSSELAKFVYVLHSGQHISNSCKLVDFLKWYNKE